LYTGQHVFYLEDGTKLAECTATENFFNGYYFPDFGIVLHPTEDEIVVTLSGVVISSTPGLPAERSQFSVQICLDAKQREEADKKE
jgi:hypothetical protein